ncbi:hypothetical protein B0J17DRAFT_719703 [Rhizoctonia solani]|nr:hypothetical protein B0J17DRAFT_719703 [Rhizoctonia solani]
MSTRHACQDDDTSVRSISAHAGNDIQKRTTEAPMQMIATEEKPGVGVVQNIEKLKQDSVAHDSEALASPGRSLGGLSSNSQTGLSHVQQNGRASKYQFEDIDSEDELDADDIDLNLSEFSDSFKRVQALAAALDRELNKIHDPTLPNRVDYFEGKISQRLKRIE